jgi:hypothetical protein
MVVKFGWMALLWTACSGNTQVGQDQGQIANSPLAVAMNQRTFVSPATTPPGSACNTYVLRAGNPNASSGGGPANGLSLEVSQTVVDYSIVVDVTDNGRELTQKIYDAAFFEAGKRDDFSVTSSGASVLLRFWGTADPGGHPQCAPFTDDGSQIPLQMPSM